MASVTYEENNQVTVTGGNVRTIVFFSFGIGGEKVEVYIPTMYFQNCPFKAAVEILQVSMEELKKMGILRLHPEVEILDGRICL